LLQIQNIYRESTLHVDGVRVCVRAAALHLLPLAAAAAEPAQLQS
jgi:hypothetical protein